MKPNHRVPTSWRRLLFGPVAVTTTTAVLAIAGVGTGITVGGQGWLLAWLLLGLTAGYALSGSV